MPAQLSIALIFNDEDNMCYKCTAPKIPGKALCRAHWNERVRANRHKYPLSKQARHKSNVRSYAHTYVKRGKIAKTPCIICRNGKSEMHHPDYSRPLLVIWLCRACHLSLHETYG